MQPPRQHGHLPWRWVVHDASLDRPAHCSYTADQRGSPTHEGGGTRQGSGALPGARPQPEYITSFGGGIDAGGGAWRAQQGGGAAAGPGHDEQGPKDALPGAADPAREGPAFLPAAALKLHGVRPEERRERYGSVSGRVRPGEPRRAGTMLLHGCVPGSLAQALHQGGGGVGIHQALSVCTAAAAPGCNHASVPQTAGQHAQSQTKARTNPNKRDALCPGLQDYSKARSSAATAAAAATVVRAVDKSKETPQERLKRLMAAQLNKKIQKDSLSAAQVRAGLAVRVEAWHALDGFCLPSRVLRPFALAPCPLLLKPPPTPRNPIPQKQQQAEADQRARAAQEAAALDSERHERQRERGYGRGRSRSTDARHGRGRSRSRSRDRQRYGGSGDDRAWRRGSRSRSREREYGRDRQYRGSSR